MTDIATTFTSFLGKHAVDLSNIAGALGALVNAIPLDHQDKDHVTSIISGLENAASNIKNFLDNSSTNEDVVVKESDIENAVKHVLETDPNLHPGTQPGTVTNA